MRVLFSCRPFHGHFHPMVPLARALKVEGHDAAFASSDPLTDLIQGAGFTTFHAGLSVEQWRAELRRRFGTIELAQGGTDQREWAFRCLFSEVEAPPRLNDLLAIIGRWRPDVVVHDMAEYAGPLAAAVRGLPCATFGYGPRLDSDLVDAGAEAMSAQWCSAGLDGRRARIRGSLYFDPCPPSLQRPSVDQAYRICRIRPELAEEVDGLAPPLTSTPGPANLYLTLGTFFNRDVSLFTTVLDALADLPVNVLVTVGPGVDPNAIRNPPDNAKLLRYVPQARVLRNCHLVICHAGWGSMIGALSAGVPVLALPRGADHFDNAEQLVRAGAGRCITPSDLTPETIAAEVRLLLSHDTFRKAAGRISAEIAAMPAPGDAIVELQSLVNGAVVSKLPPSRRSARAS